ncbi:inositol monophosphatase [candidate division WOR-3 bacterium]|nr:inositol monophosphatase [candidate division WOR-3 bacterium]
MDEKLGFLKEVSNEAGKILLGCFGKPFEIKGKAGSELVTTADIKSEEFIITALRRRYPDIGVIAEESNSREWEKKEVFIVDPLDGTHNFAYGIPFFSISIAYKINREIILGIVYDPIHKELFSCIKGSGAWLNEEQIKVSDRENLNDSILATGFPYIREDIKDSNIPEFSKFLMRTRGLRRLGSAALDLAYVACGRLDGFWEKHIKLWDISAGGLLVLEAGGRVSNFYNNDWDNRKDNIVASNGKIHREMIRIIKGVHQG